MAASLPTRFRFEDGRKEYEIDLLVLWPNVGMAAIEVKGGQVTIDNGQWYQSGRNQKRIIKALWLSPRAHFMH